jgi:hypothetical protein
MNSVNIRVSNTVPHVTNSNLRFWDSCPLGTSTCLSCPGSSDIWWWPMLEHLNGGSGHRPRRKTGVWDQEIESSHPQASIFSTVGSKVNELRLVWDGQEADRLEDSGPMASNKFLQHLSAGFPHTAHPQGASLWIFLPPHLPPLANSPSVTWRAITDPATCVISRWKAVFFHISLLQWITSWCVCSIVRWCKHHASRCLASLFTSMS